MVRTTSSAVRGVLLGAYDGTSDLTPFINTATVMVDRVVACAAAKGITLTDAESELIETWLAAHNYCAPDRPAQSERNLSSSATYQGQTGKNLESTYFGQTALDIDYSGCLAAISSKKRVRLLWLGKPVIDQIDYRDRN